MCIFKIPTTLCKNIVFISAITTYLEGVTIWGYVWETKLKNQSRCINNKLRTPIITVTFHNMWRTIVNNNKMYDHSGCNDMAVGVVSWIQRSSAIQFYVTRIISISFSLILTCCTWMKLSVRYISSWTALSLRNLLPRCNFNLLLFANELKKQNAQFVKINFKNIFLNLYHYVKIKCHVRKYSAV
jgi:hypothetical protein